MTSTAHKTLTTASISKAAATFERWRLNAVLLLMAAYIVFNLGFSLLRLPPVGPGVPIAEVVIVLFALSLVYDARLFTAFARSAPLLLLLAWWSLAAIHLAVEVPQFGFWAVRDASHYIETSYIWIGFCVASTPYFAAVFEWFLSRTFAAAICMLLAYPFRNQLAEITPGIPSVSGYTASLLFSYINASSAAMTGVFRMLVARRIYFLSNLVAGVVLFVLVALVQARIVYLQIAIVILLLFFLKPQRLSKLALMVLIGTMSTFAILSLGIDMPGRLGQSFSWDFLVNHFAAIWGGGDDSVKDAAEGVDLRLYWLERVVEMVNSNPITSLFGLGYGEALTPFEGPDGDVVREPHNSFLSVYGRVGLVGFLLFLAIQIRIYWTCVALLVRAAQAKNARYLDFGQTILCFLLMNLMFCLVECGFEVSYVAVPYYFMVGVLFSIHDRLRNGMYRARFAGGSNY
ncbi:O-antigen ligase [Bradyrhizobium liaoningense]|uniref:O-antigen ligase family protein n=1 Tax=Bradyrhizobium liaoningense TaxID=43992 RepID=UPI001BACCAAC|nr:O-antigen ligase family protein [Bradyrhizobium liaoningense]MBR0903883.1 O-antigen ligase family protein [Bradyrhizobium liaoningense]